MMNKQRFISLLLAAAVFCGITACGDNTDIADNADTIAPTDTSDSEYTLGITKQNLDEVITFLSVTNYTDNFKLIPVSERGDVLDEAGHKRALAVSELLGVTYDKYDVIHTDMYNILNSSVMSGDGVYDFVLPHANIGVASMVADGLLLDWNELDYVDFTKPWWNTRMQDTISIAGKTFLASGDINVTWQGMQGIIFNRDYLEEYRLNDDLYALAREGKWTMDKMLSLVSGISDDLNGDQAMTEVDQYGFLSTGIGVNFQIAAGQPITELDSDGCPVLSMGSERMTNIVEKYYALMSSNDSFYASYSSTDYETSVFRDIFASGRSFLTALDIGSFYMKLRELEYDFGILPMPKYDEMQENYNTAVAAGIIGIPVDADPEVCGMVAEALAYYSYEYVRPAFFDVVLQNKALRDEESYEMLTIMHESKYFDVGYNLSSAFRMLDQVVVLQNSTDFSSFYASKVDSYNQELRDIFDAVSE